MNAFPELNLPIYELNISKNDGRFYVFDPIRKQKVVLTPEEWIRQNFIQFLIKNRGYPKSLISVESGLKYNNRSKRSDIVVYNLEGSPSVLVECKSVETKINQATFNQTAVYNKTLKASIVIITNGLEHFCYRVNVDDGEFEFLEDVPHYK